jgi:hypothetical protein
VDYAEFSGWALRENSPVPLHFPTVLEWAQALDPGDFKAPFGALRRLGDPVPEAFKKRLSSTFGVVNSASDEDCEAELIIAERKIETPKKVQLMLAELEASWDRPDGAALTEATEVASCARELSAGFYYRWIWPRKEPKEVIDAWLEARRNWFAELRARNKRGGLHMDSPALIQAAADRWHFGYEFEGHIFKPRSKSGPLPVFECDFWPRWKELEHTAKPSTEAVWVDDFLVKDGAAWLTENVGIVWYMHTAFGEALEKMTKLRRYGSGPEASAEIFKESGKKSIIASIHAHGTGKKLQMFNRCLVANPPSDGAIWEQLLGRTHRHGQLADEVQFDIYRHTVSYEKALETAKNLAAHIEGTFGNPQRLISKAEWRR